MEEKRKEITIKPIARKQGEYIAYYRDRFLQATYSVCFTDSITGAVALHKFHGMVTQTLTTTKVELMLSGTALHFKSRALLELLTDREDTDGSERSVY